MAEIVLLGAGKYIPRDRFRADYSQNYVERKRYILPRRYLSEDISKPKAEIKKVTEPKVKKQVQPEIYHSEAILAPNKDIFKKLIDDQHETKFSFKKYANHAVLATCSLLLLMGAWMMISGLRDNQAVHAQAVKLTSQVNNSNSDVTTSSDQVPTTVKPTSQQYASYIVSPDAPRYIKIPSIGVNARVLNAGLLKDGSIATPGSVYDTAWYNQSAKPGQPGATFIDGHVSSWTSHGVFYDIKNLKAGDTIQIVKGDNSVVNYVVVTSKIYDAKNVDMKAALSPIDRSASGLNIITCTGKLIKGTSEFNERVVVFAKEVTN